jgi:hypothetical protein
MPDSSISGQNESRSHVIRAGATSRSGTIA